MGNRKRDRKNIAHKGKFGIKKMDPKKVSSVK
jgi:hypothetical protein